MKLWSRLGSVVFLIGSVLLMTCSAVSAVPPGSPAAPPGLINPADGSITTGLSDPPLGLPTTRWQAVPGASKYHIQISSSAGFASRRLPAQHRQVDDLERWADDCRLAAQPVDLGQQHLAHDQGRVHWDAEQPGIV